MVLGNGPQQPENQANVAVHGQPTKSRVLAVIDTNFFIDHLLLISKLADVAAIHGILIVVPWIVLQELDGLKTSSKIPRPQEGLDSSEKVGALARNSSRFLEREIERNDSPFRFQKRSEYLQHEQINDDKILDCCLYISEKHQLPVVLLTKDRNLGIKARVNGCAVFSEALTRVDELVSGINAASGKVQPVTGQNNDGSSSTATTTSTMLGPRTERIIAGSTLTGARGSGRRIAAVSKSFKKSSKMAQMPLPLPHQQPQITPMTASYSHGAENDNDGSSATEPSAKRKARGLGNSPQKTPEIPRNSALQRPRTRAKTDRSRRHSSNIKSVAAPAPYTQQTKVLNWDEFPFTFAIPSNIPEVDNRVSCLAAGNSSGITHGPTANVHKVAAQDTDTMDVDSADETANNACNNQTGSLPQPASTASAAVTAPAIVDKGPSPWIPQADVVRPSLKRPNSPERADQPIIIIMDESPLKTKQVRQSIAQRTATSISEDIVQYMCDIKYCALTNLLMERLEKRDIASLHLGSLGTRFDTPPWHTCTVIFTAVLYYWGVLKQVLPRGMEASIRRSLPWVMYVEGTQSCPQLKQPLPPQLRITPFTHMPNSSQETKDAELISETKLLVQLAKRLLAQCALAETDIQEQQRQKLVSNWVTWQSTKA